MHRSTFLRAGLCAGGLLGLVATGSSILAQDDNFRRGESNGDLRVDISDAVFTLGALFLGTQELACLDAADSNDSGKVDISDPVHTLGWLFLGAPAPPAPGPELCGPDPTPDEIGCERYAGCEQGCGAKPLASAGPDREAAPGAIVKLDGTGSSDPEGNELAFAWRLLSRPTGSAAVLLDATSAAPTVLLDRAGEYRIELVVSDCEASSEPDTVVAVAANSPPVARAGLDQTVVVGETVELDGSGSDPEGDPIAFLWTMARKPAGSTAAVSNATTANGSFVPDRGGEYTLELTVTDDQGASASDAVTITAGHAPVITSEPVTGASVGKPYAYDVEAADTDPGDVLAFSLARSPLGMSIDPETGRIDWTPLPAQAGAHEVRVVVTDAISLMDTQVFEVQATAAAAPSAVDDEYSVRVGETLTIPAPGILANDSDPNGEPLTARLVSTPVNGALTLEPDGSFVYTPHPLTPGIAVEARRVNLATAVPGATFAATSFALYREIFGTESFGAPASAFDDRLGSSWNGTLVPSSFIEVRFPVEVTVVEVQALGHRSPGRAANGRITGGVVEIFGAGESLLFTSGAVSLTGPFSDLVLPIPTLAGVRRVRFTAATVSGAGIPGLAELRVLGGATLTRRTTPADSNLCQLYAVTPTASSSLLPAQFAVDGAEGSPWFADFSDTIAAGGAPFYEVLFPVDATVTEIRAANPASTPDGFGSSTEISCFGRFELFDAAGGLLFDSGIINSPKGNLSASIKVTLPVPSVAGVRRLRYTLTTDCTGWPLGFSEITVLGPASEPSLDLRLKLQALETLEVHSTPLVVNLTDDNGDGRIDENDIPDIVAINEAPSNELGGVLRAVSGDDGRLLWSAGEPDLVAPWANGAAGDIDGDGFVEIVAPHKDGNKLVAFEHDGTFKWTSTVRDLPGYSPAGTPGGGGAVHIANLDGAGRPEIIVGPLVYNADGVLIGDGFALMGNPFLYSQNWSLSAVSDIDLDGVPELIAGPAAFRLVNGQLTNVWGRGVPHFLFPEIVFLGDGFPAIGNLDDDPFAEVVIVGACPLGCDPFGDDFTFEINPGIVVLNHDGSNAELWNPPSHAPKVIPGGVGAIAGAPTIADYDGDGRAEIGVVTAGAYTVYEADGSVLWSQAVFDYSSSTGSTTFDFDRDGGSEVVYRDQKFLRIWRGKDGLLLAKVPVFSSTWIEDPVVADVDNDGHAEIIVSSDDPTPGNRGIHVFEDIADQWGRTRRIWNQGAYHITNVNEDGTIPLVEEPNWLTPGLNNFRLNTYPRGPEGADSFSYVASDGALDSSAATVRIAVLSQSNAPEIRSTPPGFAAVGVLYEYPVLAADPDPEDALAFSLPEAPPGMTLGPGGRVTWTPTAAQLGSHDAVLRVDDSRGLFAVQPFQITVVEPVLVPDVVGEEQAAAAAAIAAAALALGSVGSQHDLAAQSGRVLTQEPAAGSLAVPGAVVSLVVSLGPSPRDIDHDGDGLSENEGDCDDADRAIGPGAIEVPGNGVDEDCDGSDPPDPRLADDDGDGFSELEGDCDDEDPDASPGAAETAGDGIDDDCNGADAVAGDVTLPVAILESPADDSVLAMPTEIRGTATDANFLRYVIDVAPVGTTSFVRVATGTAPVTNGVLGILDPTLLENGVYRVVLFVEDKNGQVEADERVVRASGQAKVGVFTLSFVDLEIPVAGIPITVTRTYDSRAKESRDFGMGWSLGVKSGKVQHNRPPGLGWVIRQAPGPFGLPCQIVDEIRSHFTEVRLSDREHYVFRPRLVDVAALGGGCAATVAFEYETGTFPGATLEVLGSAGVIYTSGGVLTVFDGGEDTGLVFDPHEVRLTTADGRVIDFELRSGVTRLEDPNGNELTITDDGIEHSSGRSIDFERDALGRIRRITDPSGRHLDYTYDSRGDLVAFDDQEGNRTTFRYDDRHNLTEIRDPLGNRAVRSEYDEGGRLVAVIDAKGNRRELEHDIDARQEVITDRLGHTTVYRYDEEGNVLSVTDPLGGRIEYTHDAQGNELTFTDALGRVFRRTYDASGNRLREIDPDGNTKSFTYNAMNRVLSSTNAEGNTTTRAYDRRGNLTEVVDENGSRTTYGHDDSGNVTSETDPLGNVTTYTHEDGGGTATTTDPLGHVTTRTYDENENLLTESRTRTLPDGSTEILTTSFEYDVKGRLIRETAPDGAVTTSTFDAAGRRLARTGPDGAVTRFEYDAVGDLVRTIFPNGAVELRSHDAEGRLVSLTDADGRVERYEFDALGRRTAVIHPDGAVRRTEWDAIGRRVSQTDERGNVTRWAYGPNRQTVTDPAGNTTIHDFDRNGRRVRITDALGRMTSFTRDARGNLLATTFADGTTTRSTYDGANRRTSETDAAGRTTAFEYDASGRLVSVTDPAGGITRYAYDEVGNLLTHTDALGRSRRMDYDAAGRLVRRQLPLGQVETFEYDATGNRTSHTDFIGETVRFTYDGMSRLLEKTFPDGSSVRFEHTAAGLRTRAGDAVSTHDVTGRLVEETQASGEAISYTYDAAGNRTSVATPAGVTTYAWDALNRLATVTDAAGRATAYTYDAVGNRASVVYPNGVTTSYTYDALNRLRRLSNQGPGGLLSAYTYTLSPTGHRLRVEETGSATTGRAVDYTYDAAGRLVREAITETATANDTVISYTHDAVGNRLSRVIVVGATTTTTTYAHDQNDRLASEVTSETVALGPGGGRRDLLAAASWEAGVLFGSLGLIPLWLIAQLARRLPFERRRRRIALAGSYVARSLLFAALLVLAYRPETFAHVSQSAALYRAMTMAALGDLPSTGTITYTHDQNGNLLTRSQGGSTDSFAYDFEDHLVSADIRTGSTPGLTTYGYDADGVRTSKTSGGVTTSYLVDRNRDLAQVLLESTGGSRTAYVHGDDLISRTGPAGGGGTTTSFYIHDGQLSTRQLTDPAGGVTDRYTYDAFGCLLDSTGATPNDFLYAGEQLDPNAGLYYLRARWYAQAQGRFITQDPWQGETRDPVTLHKYLYAHADPVNNVDPSGLADFSLIGVAIAGGIVALLVGIFVQKQVFDATGNPYIALGAGIVAAVLVFLFRSVVFRFGARGMRFLRRLVQRHFGPRPPPPPSAEDLLAQRFLDKAVSRAAQDQLGAMTSTGGALTIGGGHSGTLVAFLLGLALDQASHTNQPTAKRAWELLAGEIEATAAEDGVVTVGAEDE